MMVSYHCHEITATGETLGPTIEVRTHVRVEPTDGRDPATFETAGRWTRHFEAEAMLIPSPVPS